MSPFAKQVLHFLRDNAWPMIPVAFCEGPGGTVLMAGEERWTRYFLQRFHGEKWTREELGSYRAWQIPEILARHGSRTDMVMARLDLLSTRLLRMPDFLRVPEWVRMVARVPDAGAPPSSRSAKEDLRRIRLHGLTWRASHDLNEFRQHLHRDYYPYTRLRYGEDAFVQPSRLLETAFRKGGLLVVEKDTRPVAGMVFKIRKNILQMWAMACTASDESLLSKRALAAVYAFSFEYARATGLDFVDMRGCRPCPADSLFFVKQKWGAEVREHGELAFEFLIRWDSANDRVLRFLERTPLIFRDNDGLSVVGTADGESAPRWREAGLLRFHAVSAAQTVQTSHPTANEPAAAGGENRILGRHVQFSE